MSLQIISTAVLRSYLSEMPQGLNQAFEALQDAVLSTPDFSFYTSVASVFSSKIEGEPIDLDSYIKHKRDGLGFQPDYTRKIDDLYAAYQYAQTHPLNEENIMQAYKLLSRHLVATPWQGKYRQQLMYVATQEGNIEYVAAQPQSVPFEMEKLLADIELLLNREMPIEEAFYYASMLHLVFVKIHPWNDGNGRSARLIEKWFLAEKLGPRAWFLQSEKNYYQHHQAYYHHIRALGLKYEDLDYAKALPFLWILPGSLFTNNRDKI
jgi:Fic family protein